MTLRTHFTVGLPFSRIKLYYEIMKKARNKKLKKVTPQLNSMKPIWIPFAILIIVTGSCRSFPLVTSTSAIQDDEGRSKTLSSDPSELPDQPINTPDFSGIPTPLSELNQFVKMAKQDLASRLKINTNEISLLKIIEINWQDITQGCSSTSDKALTKGKISGYRIWLEANGDEYAFHVGLDGRVILCSN